MGKEDATNRVHLNKHIYLLHTYTGNNKHACSKVMKARIQATKALQPTTINDVQALKQFYLSGLGATSFTQINKERPPSKARESDWTSWVFMVRDLGDRTGSARPSRVPAPSRCLDGASRDVCPHGS